MRLLKLSSILFACLLFIGVFAAPQLSAGHHHHHRHHGCKTYKSSSVSFNFGVGSLLGLGIARPAYEQVTVVRPAPAYVEQRVIYPGYSERVIVQRPYQEQVYVAPSYTSYTTYSYWR